MSDPIADILTRIRNASQAGHAETVAPYSKLKEALVNLFVREGFIGGVEVLGTNKRLLRLKLRYTPDGASIVTGIRRVSTPGQRFYAPFSKIPRVTGGIGVTVVSTSKGLMTDRQARQEKIGGEVLCQIW